jgi:hypothetical protein
MRFAVHWKTGISLALRVVGVKTGMQSRLRTMGAPWVLCAASGV